ncbi:MAG: hypothetical protein JWM09_470 [Francisellaceae bacterium]|nr:hypothetical protein [Francisellaceae bacterium]
MESYFQILEDLLLAIRLPIFTKRTKRKMFSHPKFYFFDVGVYRSIRPTGPFDSLSEAEGAALETLILQEIRGINEYFQLEYEFYYWHTTSRLEVDFILYGEKGLLAFEIKRSNQVHSKDLKSLKSFGQDYPEAKLYLLYGGTQMQYHEKITVIPYKEALVKLLSLLQGSFSLN